MISPQSESFAIIILAAGKGKRMKNTELPKVLVKLLGKPLIEYVLEQAGTLKPEKSVIIIGHQKNMVIDFVESLNIRNLTFAVQSDQLGTGHAVVQAEPFFNEYDGNILILSGDVPLLRASTLKSFIKQHFNSDSDLSVLTAVAADPEGYGRIVRDENGIFSRIVEHKDADQKIKEINEINSGIYFVKSKLLFESLKKVSNNNSQAEYYLTDIIEILKNQNSKVMAFTEAKFEELQGINSPEQLIEVEKYMKLNSLSER